eukprot:XP_001698440.1 predicted protein [Chlamydomonas reinhardtii]
MSSGGWGSDRERLQLFALELERTPERQALSSYEGTVIGDICARMVSFVQLAEAASNFGDTAAVFQNGYALLSELGDLLADLESSVLRLPVHLGNEPRCKAALDELQALLGNVAQYRAEAEDTRCHLEAALSELVQSSGDPSGEASPSGSIAGVTAQTAAMAASPGVAAPPDLSLSAPQPQAQPPQRQEPGGPHGEVLDRVRRVICSLGLDVDMAEEEDSEGEEEQARFGVAMVLTGIAEEPEEEAAEEEGQGLEAVMSAWQALARQSAPAGTGAQGVAQEEREPTRSRVERKGSRRARHGPGGPEDPFDHGRSSVGGRTSASGRISASGSSNYASCVSSPSSASPPGRISAAGNGYVPPLQILRPLAAPAAPPPPLMLAPLRESDEPAARRRKTGGQQLTDEELMAEATAVAAAATAELRLRRRSSVSSLRRTLSMDAVEEGAGLEDEEGEEAGFAEQLPELSLGSEGGGGLGGGLHEAASVAALRRLNRVTRLAGIGGGAFMSPRAAAIAHRFNMAAVSDAAFVTHPDVSLCAAAQAQQHLLAQQLGALAGLAGGGGAVAGGGGAGEGGAGAAAPVLDFGPDVPTLDLHKDISGWGACLGRGAFGAVYKAMWRNRPVAVKVLHGGALDARDLRALRTEICLLAAPRLRSAPNIISVHGAAATPFGDVALVTELMDCDLYDYIHRRRQNCVPMDEVLLIARSIAAGLAALHPAIVHRDLKPANVLLRHSAVGAKEGAAGAKEGAGAAGAAGPAGAGGSRLVVKIADFGLARHKRSQYLSTRERNAGTLKYLAPDSAELVAELDAFIEQHAQGLPLQGRILVLYPVAHGAVSVSF